MRCFQSHEQVNVICHTSNALGNSTQAAHCRAEIFMHFRAPGIVDKWSSLFCAENNVVMKTSIGEPMIMRPTI